MAYGKDDFIDFSELDLNELLGEDYTCSEIESDDDCVVKKKSKSKCVDKSKTVTKAKLYQCDKCDNDYASISGLRGHLRSKHGIINTKASKYRKGQTTQESRPFVIEESVFQIFFDGIFSDTITDMKDNELRKKTTGVGKMITNVAEKLCVQNDISKEIKEKLCSRYYCVFDSASQSVGCTNEVLYTNFYKMTEDMSLNSAIQELVKPLSEKNVRPFVGVLLHSLMRMIINRQSQLYEQNRNDNENIKPITETDQCVVFYISGYIIQTLGRKSSRKLTNSKLQALNEAMEHCLRDEKASEKTFVNKYAEWTDKTNRGGLKIPSDNFFLMVREFEMCCREEINEGCESKLMLDKVLLREAIMDRFLVKHYADKLFSGHYVCYILESVVNIFLTVRGHAWARKRKIEENETNSQNKKALRKSLMEYTQR